MKDLRLAIIRLHENGYGKREISRMLTVPYTTVHRDIERYEETGRNKDRPGRGRKKTARSRRNIQRAKGAVEHPGRKKNNY